MGTDINKLKNILKGAKSVMNKVDSGDYKTGGVDPTLFSQNINEAVETPTGVSTFSKKPMNYNEEQIQGSRLPSNIKEAMLKNPIKKPNISLSNTFSLEDVYDEDFGKPMPTNYIPKQQVREQVTQPNYGSVDRNEIKGLIKEVLMEFMVNEYSKNLTENTIKKTINTLIKEGKIRVKK